MGARAYFQTTRGRIVAELRRRSHATAAELAERFSISPNAVRQHLTELVRDGAVTERSARRGPTKPTLEFMLTPQADALFPQQYDKLLNAVLREVRDQHGDGGVAEIFRGLAGKVRRRHGPALVMPDPRARAENLATFLRHQGVEVDVEQPTSDLIVLSEHNCPYGQSVAEHPEVCTIVHDLLSDVAPHGYEQTSSISSGDRTCRFELRTRSQES